MSTLIDAMGREAEDIFASFGLSDAELKNCDGVMTKFEGYFVQYKNPIFERAKFNQRVQAETETVDQFVTALCALVEHCEYAGLKEQMICDSLVVGLRDSKLSEQARSSHRFEGSNEPPFVRQVSFFFLFACERALSCHHTTFLQLKQSI